MFSPNSPFRAEVLPFEPLVTLHVVPAPAIKQSCGSIYRWPALSTGTHILHLLYPYLTTEALKQHKSCPQPEAHQHDRHLFSVQQLGPDQ